MLWWYRKCQKKLKLRENGASEDQNFVCSDNPGQSMWNKIEKSGKTEWDKKSLKSTLACFLTALAKV